MKVLLINNFFSDVGGAEIQTARTGDILSKNGHDVFYFATNKQPYRFKCYEYSDYFPEYNNYSSMSLLKKLYNAPKLINNTEAFKKLSLYIDIIKPDIAHINNISYNLTPSVLKAVNIKKVPIVMTMHNPYMLCPSVRMLFKNQSYCKEEHCIGGSSINCILNCCFDNSFSKSLMAVFEYLYHRYMKTFDCVSYFIAPSEALKKLAIKSGISKEKVIIINNVLDDVCFSNLSEDGTYKYFLYPGRLSYEKGVDTIIEAMQFLPADIMVHIVGDGDQKEFLVQQANKYNLKNIIFYGYKRDNDLYEQYNNCIACIMPTRGFETFGLSAAEACAFSRPVIASNVGGIPEIVENNINGLLVEPDNPELLAKAMLKLYNNKELATNMGAKGFIKARENYISDTYYKKLVNIYNRAIE